MSSFLERIAQRQLAPTLAVRPRSGSRFAPVADEPSPATSFVEVGRRLASVGPLTETVAPSSPADVQLSPKRPLLEREASEPRADRDHTASPEANEPAPAARTDAARDVDAAPAPLRVSTESWDTPRRVESEPDARDQGITARRALSTREPLVPMSVVVAQRVPDRPVRTAGMSSTPRVAEAASLDEPVVRISIGRIEVRAVAPPPVPVERVAAPRPKALTLDDYLDRRHGPRR